VADLLGRPATPEGEAKTYLEDLMLYSYLLVLLAPDEDPRL